MYIEIKNLSKTISHSVILSNINMHLESGKIYGLRGKNGSGKTMLMRAICGLIIPTEGEVIINGERLGKEISFPRSIGALIEYPGFIANNSGLKNLQILASIQKKIGNDKIVRTMTELGLDPQDPKKVKKYSLGMKQKLGIAAAIMEEPDIIVLDEPINALDEESISIVQNILMQNKKRGALIIISCHDRDELEFLSDEVFLIENGAIQENYLLPNTNEEFRGEMI